uniref:Uncharacterized protein n=1 Tax=Candida parapsilosis (strain CDC 317 / ATCC MYA-4646) TaxID=578454 RepID=A0AAJ8W0M3_CANPC
MSKSVIQFSLN